MALYKSRMCMVWVGLFAAIGGACGSDEPVARSGSSTPVPNLGPIQAIAGGPAPAARPPVSATPSGSAPVTTPAITTPPPAAAPGVTPPPTGTAPPPPTNVTPPAPGMSGTGTVPPPAPGGEAAPVGTGGAPVVPMVKGECPKFANGTISFMGLGGIKVVAGTKAAGPTAPMVFYWHGTGSSSGEYASMAGAVQQGVVAEGGVLISFQGTTGGDFLSGTSIFGKSDFELTDQLLACAVKDHNVDPKRVYATGCSAGGLFSGAMAAARSNYIAAAAPNSGGWTAPVAFQGMWTPALMTIHGAMGKDVVGVDFSTTSATADKAFKQRGAFVVNCDHGGGHCGGGGLAPDIWKFFKAHTYGLTPSPWKDALPAGFNAKCKIY